MQIKLTISYDGTDFVKKSYRFFFINFFVNINILR